MTENDANREPEPDRIYLGNKIPLFLKFTYIGFIGWALAYLIKYLLPDLKAWLR